MNDKAMPKITIELEDSLNRRVRKYIYENFPDSPYGKLKDVVEMALREFLDNRKY